ncbi:unnamed protein product (macronuclear) [Paramecium tetraurelia]|uniref:Uncharacterized protein n=1 Tax=Paramecium tetraurelia TaxID=5888 RepID=A0CHY9_PARTE|nr:uncharacterized protein GSPATT00038508001 [Paramecium tetraurelia]CAK70406.1 unnamed protein product [Paramecium tetraurelia]|eukprot:XP_001437803.1 hypothetical protein (macronuclear) [Paramecium tetraurelia strain d4-2]
MNLFTFQDIARMRIYLEILFKFGMLGSINLLVVFKLIQIIYLVGNRGLYTKIEMSILKLGACFCIKEQLNIQFIVNL